MHDSNITGEEDVELEDTVEGGGSGGATSSKGQMYLPYDPAYFSFLHMYRPQNDVVAQLILQSGMEGIDRVEISKHLGINAKTKAGNRSVSNSIHAVLKAYPNTFGQFQKMEGKHRFIKYYVKGADHTPGGKELGEFFKRFEQLTGTECPYKLGEVIKFPGQDLRPLRMSDVALKRMVRILEYLYEQKVILRLKLDIYISAKDREEGYAYQMDRKTLKKYLLCMAKRRFLNLLNMELVERGRPVSVDLVTVPQIDAVDNPEVVEFLERILADYKEQGRSFPSGIRVKQEPVEEPPGEDDAVHEEQPEECESSMMKQEPPDEVASPASGAGGSLLHRTFNTLQRESLKKYRNSWKTGVPPITTLSQRSLNTLVDSAKQRRLTRLSSGGRKRKTVMVKQEMELAADRDQQDEPDERGQRARSGVTRQLDRRSKNRMDRVDIQSLQHKAYLRSRFTQRERDMLLLIRALSFFLNPVNRFWPHPKVVRMLMHEYVPESRSKTTYSLMAAGVREVRSKDRFAHHQYIVKTMASFKELLQLRNQMAQLNMKLPKTTASSAEAETNADFDGKGQLRQKDYFFADAFRASYQLLFRESPDFPSVKVADAELRRYLTRNGLYFLTISDRMSAELRTKKPLDERAVRHCAAYNAIMSVLLSASPESGVKNEAKVEGEEEVGTVAGIEQQPMETTTTTAETTTTDGGGLSAESNFVIEQLGIETLAEVLAQMRTDGLITRKRGLQKQQSQQHQQEEAEKDAGEEDEVATQQQRAEVAAQLRQLGAVQEEEDEPVEQQQKRGGAADGTTSGLRNQLYCTQFYRHYFQPEYHKYLTSSVSQLYKDLLSHYGDEEEPQVVDHEFGGGDNPGQLLALSNHLCQIENQQVSAIETSMPGSMTELFVMQKTDDDNLDNSARESVLNLTAAATKQLRYLESAELQLELLRIRPEGIEEAANAMLRSLPEPMELVAPQLVPATELVPLPAEIEEVAGNVAEEQSKAGSSTTAGQHVEDAMPAICNDNPALAKLFNTIESAGIVGISEEELKEQLESDGELLDIEELQRNLDALVQARVVVVCGVDKQRFVSTKRNAGTWLVRNLAGQGFVPRPWVLPSGQINWQILRWMLEGVFSMIFNRPGLTTDELVSHFLFVLQPSYTTELLQMLVQLGCCTVCEKVLTGMCKTAPFSRFGKIQTVKFVKANTDGMERLVLFGEHKLKPLSEEENRRDQQQQQNQLI